ncbi:MAG: hypothetical protein Fur0041_19470 [Bacteroidia bacterium]
MSHIGVWLDHSKAHMITESSAGNYAIQTIHSLLDKHPREAGQGSDLTQAAKGRFGNDEYTKNNQERGDLKSYYKMLQDVLEQYDQILLFGPTSAKKELFNLIMENKAFGGKKIDVENADKLTENQMVAVVREYFAEKVK